MYVCLWYLGKLTRLYAYGLNLNVLGISGSNGRSRVVCIASTRDSDLSSLICILVFIEITFYTLFIL